MKPQLIKNLVNRELIPMKYYKRGMKNKSTFKIFKFNDSFFIKCKIKQFIIFGTITKQNSLIKCKIKAVFWNKQNTLPPSQETCHKHKTL
jgi:hypothetical protein